VEFIFGSLFSSQLGYVLKKEKEKNKKEKKKVSLNGVGFVIVVAKVTLRFSQSRTH